MTAGNFQEPADTIIKKLADHFLRSPLTKIDYDCSPHIAYI